MKEKSNGIAAEEEILDQSRRSGLTYNEAKEFIARTTGGRGTSIYSNTDADQVRRQNQESMNNKDTE